MRKGVLAAACAAAMLLAGQASAATFTLDFAVSSNNWQQFHGTDSPFGLPASPVLSGELSGDTSLLTSAPGPTGGAEMLTAFSFTAGSQAFTLADISLAQSSVQVLPDNEVLFLLVLTPFTNDLGANAISNNNVAQLYDGVNDIACSGCVVNGRLVWSGLTSSPTPEPATWAMMLAGFFGLGAMLRQRRSIAAAA